MKSDEEVKKLGIIERLEYRIACLEAEVKILRGQYIKNDFIGTKNKCCVLKFCYYKEKK